jgi:hypothetical protein
MRSMKFRKTNLIECGCGEKLLRPGAVERDKDRAIEHRTDGPCYYIENTIPEDPPTPAREGKPRMKFTTYVRKPFIVQAVEISPDNIADIARFVGDLREKEDGTPYILVDPRLVPNVERVYPGFFMTKMGENVRCYSRRVFTDQFIIQSDEIKPWIDFMMNDGRQPAA